MAACKQAACHSMARTCCGMWLTYVAVAPLLGITAYLYTCLAALCHPASLPLSDNGREKKVIEGRTGLFVASDSDSEAGSGKMPWFSPHPSIPDLPFHSPDGGSPGRVFWQWHCDPPWDSLGLGLDWDTFSHKKKKAFLLGTGLFGSSQWHALSLCSAQCLFSLISHFAAFAHTCFASLMHMSSCVSSKNSIISISLSISYQPAVCIMDFHCLTFASGRRVVRTLWGSAWGDRTPLSLWLLCDWWWVMVVTLHFCIPPCTGELLPAPATYHMPPYTFCLSPPAWLWPIPVLLVFHSLHLSLAIQEEGLVLPPALCSFACYFLYTHLLALYHLYITPGGLFIIISRAGLFFLFPNLPVSPTVTLYFSLLFSFSIISNVSSLLIITIQTK